MALGPVREAGIASPSDTLITRQLTGSLCFKKQDRLLEGIRIINCCCGTMVVQEQENTQWEGVQEIWSHF